MRKGDFMLFYGVDIYILLLYYGIHCSRN